MGDVKGGLNDSLALVSSPEVACGFRYDPNHCAIPWDWGLILKQKKILSNPTSWVHLTRVNLPWWEFCPGWSGLRVGPPEWRDGRRWLPKTPLGWERKNLLPQHRLPCHHRGNGAEHCRCPGMPGNFVAYFQTYQTIFDDVWKKQCNGYRNLITFRAMVTSITTHRSVKSVK